MSPYFLPKMICFVLSNPDTDNCYSRVSGAHCTLIGEECWCYYDNVGGWSVCGYPNGYDGKYYSIALDSASYGGTIIKRLGQNTYRAPDSTDSTGYRRYCDGSYAHSTAYKCDQDARANYCPSYGCYGTSLNPSYAEKYRWEYYSPIRGDYAGIVRCIDLEGMV